MSSKDIVKVYSLSKNTKETKKIKMFQADPETLSSFRSLRGKVKYTLFIIPSSFMYMLSNILPNLEIYYLWQLYFSNHL